MKTGRVGDLEIDQDLAFEAREWRFEQVGYAVVACILAAALIGLLGRGPASHGVETGGGGLRVEYERFAHAHYPWDLRVHVPGDRPGLAIDSGFLARVYLEDVTPPPREVVAGQDGTEFRFHSKRGIGEISVSFRIQSNELGPGEFRVWLPGEPPVRVWQFVYP